MQIYNSEDSIAVCRATALVGGDTDVLVLLCYCKCESKWTRFIYAQPNKIEHSPHTIHTCHRRLWHDVKTPWYWKRSTIEEAHVQPDIQREQQRLNIADATLSQIVESGEKALEVLFCGKEVENWNSLRYNFSERTASKNTDMQSHSCRKHNIQCSPAWSQCRGSSYSSLSPVYSESDDEEIWN